MKIEDKDIDKLLEDFQGADIKVHDNLDEKLNEYLKINEDIRKTHKIGKNLLEEVKLRFDKEEISIPYPQIDLHLKQMIK